MAKAEIHAGVCGYTTTVKATALSRREVEVSLQSDCPDICALAGTLTKVDAYKEISCRGGITSIINNGLKHCAHAACPVPVGIVKAVEVAAKLALPKDVSIRVSDESE